MVKVVQFNVKKSKWIKDGVGKSENYGTKKAMAGHGSWRVAIKESRAQRSIFKGSHRHTWHRRKLT